MIKGLYETNNQVKLLLFGILLVNAGYFMVLPFIGLYLTSKLSFSVFQTGVILTILTICQWSMGFFSGIFSDKYGHKLMILLGVLIRIIGFLLFILPKSFIIFILAAFLIGTGGAMYSISSKALLVTISDTEKATVFALRSTAVNMGAAIGPLLGWYLFKTSFLLTFIITAGAHVIFLLLILKHLVNIEKAITDKSKPNIFKNFSLVVKDRNILFFFLLCIIFWTLYNQLYFTIPLIIKDQYNISSDLGIFFTINSVMIICFQYIIIKKASAKLSELGIITLGIILLSLSFCIPIIGNHYYAMYGFIIFFTFAEILIIPTIDTYTGSYAKPALLSSYLGFISISGGIGGLLGNTFGGTIYTYLKKNEDVWTIWFVFLSIAVILLLLIIRYKILVVKQEHTKVRTGSD